jgi:5-bromo-4-chloroindolyl phosphate hydrolysis protein
MNDLEPLLRIKTENKDIVRCFTETVMRSWEDKYGFVYLKKSDADKDFEYIRNEIEAIENKFKRLEKDQEQIKNSYVLHTEFTKKITEFVKRTQFNELSDYVT